MGSVAWQVLTYLSEHRAARDTLEGITEWWLLEQRIRSALAEVKQALAELVARKLVLACRRKDGQVHYRMNSRRRGTVQALVQAKAGRPSRSDRGVRQH